MIRKTKDINFNKTKRKLDSFKRVAPKLVAENTKSHFLKGFDKGGGQTDKSASGWRGRKNPQKRGSRALLVDTGNLRASIKVLSSSFRKTVIGVKSLVYAKFINEGTPNMPQREFIGKSKKLERSNKRIINRELKKIK